MSTTLSTLLAEKIKKERKNMLSIKDVETIGQFRLTERDMVGVLGKRDTNFSLVI